MTDKETRDEHSILSASATERWSICPASVGWSSGLHGTTSFFAAEGQAAHELAQACLSNQEDPAEYLGDEIPTEVGLIEIDQEMVEGVSLYVEFCRAIGDDSKFCEIEAKTDVNALWPDGDNPADMFGTADFTAHGNAERVLRVADLKYGKGVAVEIEKNGEFNKQLGYYGLGKLLEISQDSRPAWVDLYIVQPRASHPAGPIRKTRVAALDLITWGHEFLKPAAEACFVENPKAVVGDHCRWCPARGRCPALRQVAQETAKVEFDEMPPQPVDLSDAELADVLSKAEIIKAHLDGVRAEASARLDRGATIPGWKLVQKRGVRKWSSEAKVSAILQDIGLQDDEIWTRKIKSPAQIEKIVKSTEDLERLNEEITKDSSGTTLVRELDPRQAAAAGPASDFDEVED